MTLFGNASKKSSTLLMVVVIVVVVESDCWQSELQSSEEGA